MPNFFLVEVIGDIPAAEFSVELYYVVLVFREIKGVRFGISESKK